jgi:hypothetical protein
MKLVERSNCIFPTWLIDLVENIPACVGTTPQVTNITANDAQNTGQCLDDVSKNLYVALRWMYELC